LREAYYLLTNDSLNHYIMKVNGIRDIATNDSDFEQVDWITVWKPSGVRSQQNHLRAPAASIVRNHLVSINKSSEAEVCPCSKLLGIHFKIK
jgi:hypothetical protein